jgi:ParB-like chromosome segregation protein Spo0J
MQVHPIAARYPMLSNDEIKELAEDIKQHGLIHPIVVDHDVLIDGRNRLKACEVAGVEPTYRPFPWNGKTEGKEAAIIAYIVGENIRRRHLNAGQRAILVALAYPEPGHKSKPQVENSNVDKGDLSRARAIVRWCPEYVEDILAGIHVFARAFEEADQKRTQAAQVADQMKRLEAEAPDLHALVQEQKGMTAGEAIAALEQRIKAKADADADAKRKTAEALSEQQRRERDEAERLRHEREQVTRLLQGALTFFNPRGTDPRKCAERIFSDIDLASWPAGTNDASIEVWAEAAKTLTELVNVRKDHLP